MMCHFLDLSRFTVNWDQNKSETTSSLGWDDHPDGAGLHAMFEIAQGGEESSFLGIFEVISTWSWAAWVALLEQGVGPDDVQRFLPNSTVLWFFNDSLWIFCSVNAIRLLQTDLKRFHFLDLITMEMLQRKTSYWSPITRKGKRPLPLLCPSSLPWVTILTDDGCCPTSQNKCFSLPKAENPTSK